MQEPFNNLILCFTVSMIHSIYCLYICSHSEAFHLSEASSSETAADLAKFAQTLTLQEGGEGGAAGGQARVTHAASSGDISKQVRLE